MIEGFVGEDLSRLLADAWVDESYTDARDGGVGRVGYEINFNRDFYEYVPPRPLKEIEADIPPSRARS